ncbi:flagellar assembly protein FliH [Massilia sp. Root133]|uniref:flagellar assembly protein FliH n=2 Tax=unclassified Massilia TaxID=2609279 RepID=UPI0006F30625|nr:flagellar assembly protein FliH [Massilia sp. Root1485]KQX96735.1 flagellar assembly protein FliH [Massilia sp. Root133]KQZ52446.1 flagellar assembly protein FliH [Massilia sp. Root1485]
MAISKEFQSAYQRWEMTSFGDERPSVRAQREAEAAAAAAAARAYEAPPQSEPMIQLPTAQELEAIRAAARDDGYAEGLEAGEAEGHAAGYEEGLALGRAEAAEELEHLRQLATTFGDAVTQADEAIANDVLELALHLARGMVRMAFDVKPDLIIPVVREAIDYLPNLQQPALLMLHPEDALIVRSGIGHELDKNGWRIVEDDSIARGGCRVDTASNQIDAQIGARWQRLTHALGKDLDWLE